MDATAWGFTNLIVAGKAVISQESHFNYVPLVPLLQFKQVPVSIYLNTGEERKKWVDSDMPKIPTDILNCVFYLYENRLDAEKGSKYGGTGFFVGIPSKKDHRFNYVYAVTNYHVVKGGGTTIRINTTSGKPDILEFSDSDWKWVPGGGDIAVCSITHCLEDRHEIALIPLSLFATKSIIDQKGIGIGDDVFMVGRFMDHDGGPINLPAVRFGNISVMPTRIEEMSNGVRESYCIDLHSRLGFSGSPVFVYRTVGNDIETNMRQRVTVLESGFMYFLGIHWSQFKEIWPIDEEMESKEAAFKLTIQGKRVRGVSGMTCVMTVDPIFEALNIQSLRDERSQRDAALENNFRINGYPPELEY